MKWITHERAKIDRIACRWLVSQFIDEVPAFLDAPARDITRIATEIGATPYNVPNVELSHHGNQCSLDAFIARYQIRDSASTSWRPSPAASITGSRHLPGNLQAC